MIEDLRLCIYQSLARTGRMPDPAALHAIAGDQLPEALTTLAAQRHLALDTARSRSHTRSRPARSASP